MIFTLLKLIKSWFNLLVGVVGGAKGGAVILVCIIIFLFLFSPAGPSSDTDEKTIREEPVIHTGTNIPIDSYNWGTSFRKQNFDPSSTINTGISELYDNEVSMTQHLKITRKSDGGTVLEARSWYGGDELYIEWEDKDGTVYEYWNDGGDYAKKIKSTEIYPTPPPPLNSTNETGYIPESEARLITTGSGISGSMDIVKVMNWSVNPDMNLLHYQGKTNGYNSTLVVATSSSGSPKYPVYFKSGGNMNGDEVTITWNIYNIENTNLPSRHLKIKDIAED